jgi:hypothetical protein
VPGPGLFPDHHIGADHPNLKNEVDLLFYNALAPATHSSYESAWKQFCTFCSSARVSCPFDATEAVLCFYLAWLSLKASIKSFATVHKYIYAIRAFFLQACLPDPLKNKPIFDRVCMGLKKKMKGTGADRIRRPITVAILRRIRRFFDHCVRAERLLFNLFIVAVFGLMRLGELTIKPNNASYPRRSHVHFHTDGSAKLWLPHSKMDRFGRGIFIHFAPTGTDLCPVVAFHQILDDFADAGPEDPLFPCVSGRATTGAAVIDRLKLAIGSLADPTLPAAHVNGHSFRKGGAQSLYDAGCDLGTIRLLGRWSSWCVELYTELSDVKMVQVMFMMARTPDSKLLNTGRR